MDFVLEDDTYHVQRRLKDDHAEYDALGLKDTKDLIKFLGDVIAPRAYGNLLCSAI